MRRRRGGGMRRGEEEGEWRQQGFQGCLLCDCWSAVEWKEEVCVCV